MLKDQSEKNNTDEIRNSQSNASPIEPKYAKLSTASLILGCITIGFFSWFSIIQVDYIVNWFGGLLGVLIFMSFYVVTTIVGIILGALSITKGYKKRAIIGLVLSSIGMVYHVVALIFTANLYVSLLPPPDITSMLINLVFF
ncbi:MAG: hypothetical protein ACFFDW_01220 [Candidatus Thorarchaeota archaeon]